MEIKVYPLIVPKQNNKKISTDTVTPKNYNNYQNSLSGVYYKPVNFRGGGVDNSLLINELENLHGVHCPTCNVEMLTNEEFENIKEEMKNINSAEGFVSFLEQYSGNILPQYRNIIRHSRQMLLQNPDQSLLDLQKRLSAGMSTRLGKKLDTTINVIDKLKEEAEFSDKDKELIKIYMDDGRKLKDSVKYKRFLNEFRELLSNSLYKLESSHKSEISNYIYRKIKRAYECKQLFKYDFTKDYDGVSGTELFLQNLLSQSVSKIAYVDPKLSFNKDSPFNEVLECKHCRDNNRSINKSFNENDEDIIGHTKSYVEDLGQAIVSKRFTDSTDYVFMINSRINSLTNDANKKRLPKTLFHAKNMLYQQKRSDLHFDLVDYEGIPCAGCGKKTLTHNQITQIHEDILNAKDLKELVSLMNKYSDDDLIRPRYKLIVKNFKKLVYDKPNFTENNIYNKLRDNTWNSVLNQLESNAQEVRKIIEQNNLASEDKKLLYEYIDCVTKDFTRCNKDEPFPYDKYNKLLKDTIVNLKTYKKDVILYNLKNSLKAKYVAQLALYRYRDADDIMGSKLKFTLYQIVKNSVATMDHVIAKDNDGDDDINNIIVLCKDCNKEKSNTSFTYWLKHKQNVEANLQKYVNTILELISSGKIKGFDDYIQNIVKHINKAAGKEILYLDKNEK